MNDLRLVLKESGLCEKEASLYLAALSLGEASMSQLAKKAALKRATAYLNFKSLETRGLMGSFKMRSGLRFVATKPELLVAKTQQHLEQLKSALPEFIALAQKSPAKPRMAYYEGKEGYIVAAEDSLRETGSVVRYIGSLTEAHKMVGLEYDLNYYIPSRVRKRITFKGLLFRSKSEKEVTDRDHRGELRELRYLPEAYAHKTSMMIYGNRIAILSSQKELVTIIIESDDIADSERKKFDLIWDLVE